MLTNNLNKILAIFLIIFIAFVFSIVYWISIIKILLESIFKSLKFLLKYIFLNKKFL